MPRDTNPHAMFGAGARWCASRPASGGWNDTDEVCLEDQALCLTSPQRVEGHRCVFELVLEGRLTAEIPGLPAEFRPPRPYLRSGLLYQAHVRFPGVLAAKSVVNIHDRGRGADRAQHVLKVVLPGGGACE